VCGHILWQLRIWQAKRLAVHWFMVETCQSQDFQILCDRCGVELTPGRGGFYVVRIEACADPTPPTFSEDDLKRDVRAEMQRLLQQMRDLSPQEAMDQVYRRLVFYLCGPCYRRWIEDPLK
jgi:hypothetical protein